MILRMQESMDTRDQNINEIMDSFEKEMNKKLASRTVHNTNPTEEMFTKSTKRRHDSNQKIKISTSATSNRIHHDIHQRFKDRDNKFGGE